MWFGTLHKSRNKLIDDVDVEHFFKGPIIKKNHYHINNFCQMFKRLIFHKALYFDKHLDKLL